MVFGHTTGYTIWALRIQAGLRVLGCWARCGLASSLGTSSLCPDPMNLKPPIYPYNTFTTTPLNPRVLQPGYRVLRVLGTQQVHDNNWEILKTIGVYGFGFEASCCLLLDSSLWVYRGLYRVCGRLVYAPIYIPYIVSRGYFKSLYNLKLYTLNIYTLYTRNPTPQTLRPRTHDPATANSLHFARLKSLEGSHATTGRALILMQCIRSTRVVFGLCKGSKLEISPT